MSDRPDHIPCALTEVTMTTQLFIRHTMDGFDLVVCLFTPQLSLVLIVPSHRGMAKLSRPG